MKYNTVYPINKTKNSFVSEICTQKTSKLALAMSCNEPQVCVYLSLFILTASCPYGRVLQKSISHFRFFEG
jgi:hypothetical protein